MGKIRKITRSVIECDGCGKDIETEKTEGYVQCGNKLSNGIKCGKRTKI